MKKLIFISILIGMLFLSCKKDKAIDELSTADIQVIEYDIETNKKTIITTFERYTYPFIAYTSDEKIVVARHNDIFIYEDGILIDEYNISPYFFKEHSFFKISPDGKVIYFFLTYWEQGSSSPTEHNLSSYNIETKTLTNLFDIPTNDHVSNFDISANGQQLVFVLGRNGSWKSPTGDKDEEDLKQNSSTICTISVDGSNYEELILIQPRYNPNVLFSLLGDKIYYTSNIIGAYNIADGNIDTLISEFSFPNGSNIDQLNDYPVIAIDENNLYFYDDHSSISAGTSYDHELHKMSLSNNSVTTLCDGMKPQLFNTSDNMLIRTDEATHYPSDYKIINSNGAEIQAIDEGFYASISPDDNKILYLFLRY